MREQLPYMTDEQFDRIAFVYRSKEDGIRVVGLLEAKNYEDRTKYQHLATLITGGEELRGPDQVPAPRNARLIPVD